MIKANIMNRLSHSVPKRMTAYRVDRQFEMTKQLVPQIEEARLRGYSWTQIVVAVEEEMKATGEWREEWHRWDIRKNYNQLKKMGEAGEATPA